MLNHFFPVDVEDEKMLVFKMSKGEYDNFERKYKNLDRSMKLARLMQRQVELKNLLAKTVIDYTLYDAKMKEIEEEMDGLGKVVEEVKKFKLEDGSEYETNIATYSTADKLSLTVFKPVLDDKGNLKKDKHGMPEKEKMSIEFWITQCEETIFNKISDVVDYLQIFGVEEPVTVFDDIIMLFKEEIEYGTQQGEDPTMSVTEILERISNLRTSYVTGEIYRKKSESAYGVKIHGMKQGHSVENAQHTTSE